MHGCFRKRWRGGREKRKWYEEELERETGFVCVQVGCFPVNLKITLLVQQSPTLLPVTIEIYCGGATDGGALAGQIACLKTMEGKEKKQAKPKRKEGKP